MSHPPRRSHARLAMTPPASNSRDHAGQSRARAVVPGPSGQFGVVPCAATTRQRSRVTRARHLFASECPSSGKTDRNPARTHLRDPKGPHPSVTKPEEHFLFLRVRTRSWQNHRVLTTGLNAGTSTEALDLDQQSQLGMKDRQRASAVSRMRFDIIYIDQIVRWSSRSAENISTGLLKAANAWYFSILPDHAACPLSLP